jgi:hypothetical protein
MSSSVKFTVDVTAAAGIGRQAHTVVTVVLPEPGQLGDRPVVCFGLPGAGYSRNYYTFDMPGASGGRRDGQRRGRWNVVSTPQVPDLIHDDGGVAGCAAGPDRARVQAGWVSGGGGPVSDAAAASVG